MRKKGEGGDVTARELLESGAVRIQEDLADQPVVQARLLHTIGRVYASLGMYPEALDLQMQCPEAS